VSGFCVDPMSSPLRRRLGPAPWFVLEELVLVGDTQGAETNVRSLADTVARALGRLRAAGLVVAEPQGSRAGRFVTGRYRVSSFPGLQVLDERNECPSPRHPRRPAPPPLPQDGAQLSLLGDVLRTVGGHPESVDETTAWKVDALAPRVRGCHAPVPRDDEGAAQDGPSQC
jgi:hypothetical protein